MSDRRTIRAVHARRVWDSRGRPTVEAEVTLDDGAVGRAIAPAGASKGTREAVELRDGGAAFGGLDVQRAVANVEGEIASAVARPGRRRPGRARPRPRRPRRHAEQVAPRRATRSSRSRSRRRTRSPRRAASRSTSRSAGPTRRCVPMPQIQIFGGGAHAGRRVDMQDFMVVCPGARNVRQALEWTAEVYRARRRADARARRESRRRRRRRLVARRSRATRKRFARWSPRSSGPDSAPATRSRSRSTSPPPSSAAAAGTRSASSRACSTATPGSSCCCAGSTRIRSSRSRIRSPRTTPRDSSRFTRAVGKRLQIVGDDFLVSDAASCARRQRSAPRNTVLLKPNQRGTLTETLDAWRAAQALGYAGIVSARSGESEDTSIVHLAIGWSVGQLKVGSFARGERTAKWNELLRIEERLGSRARFAGSAAFGRSRSEL